MNGKTIEESRKEYEGSGLEALMKAGGHEVCTRCYCCDLFDNSAPCWQCGGFTDWDDEWDDGYCSVCGGEGEIYFKRCIGNCDEHGHHPAKQAQAPVGRDPQQASPKEMLHSKEVAEP